MIHSHLPQLRSLVLTVALVGGGFAGCDRGASKPGGPAAPSGWFADVTSLQGVDFTHDSGSSGRYFMPEHIGSGVAVFDANGDGRQDLYFVQNGDASSRAKNRLFLQQETGGFRDASTGSGLDVAGRGMAAITGDLNNDGRPEVLITEYGGVRLFLNSGRGKFREITAECGIDAPRWATAASFIDYDRDGWLDVVVGNYVDLPPSEECFDAKGMQDFCGPADFGGTTARLFRNLGRSVIPLFEDTTVRSGIVRVSGPALGVLCADFDGDRWPDIFFADDGIPNRLFINHRNGTFHEEAAFRGLALDANGAAAANMGVAAGDVNGDGLFDLFVTHLDRETHGLWVQGPRGMFKEQAAALGAGGGPNHGAGFGTVLADFDHDGAEDLVLVNGAIARLAAPAPAAPGLASFWAPYAERAQLFAGGSDGRFRDVSAECPALCALGMVGRGLAAVDFDNDGALDLVAISAGGKALLLRNEAAKRGRWLSVRALEPAHGDRDAIGAEIVLEAAGRRWLRLAQPSQSFLGSHDSRAHFGLGTAAVVDAIRVVWPDGVEERFDGGAVDRHVVLRKGEGRERTSFVAVPRAPPVAAPPRAAPAAKRAVRSGPTPAPGSRQWLIDAATAALAEREFEEAGQLIEKLLSEHAAYAKSWLLSGRLKLLTGDGAGAQQAFQRHVELAPGSEQGHFQHGLALLKLERFAEAEAAFRRATEAKFDYTAAHFNRAIAMLRLERKTEAAASFREVIRYSPDALEAYLRLASLRLESADKAGALKLLREAAYLAPNDPRVRELTARAEE